MVIFYTTFIIVGLVCSIFIMGVCSDILHDHESCRPEEDEDDLR